MNLFVRLVYLYDVFYRIYMRVVGIIQPETQATTLFGAKVRCLRTDFIQRRIAFFGLFEPNLTYFISRTLKPGDTFIDVGANIGYFTMLGSKRVGLDGKVYAIEAAPSTYDLLLHNLALNGMNNVQAFNLAATDKECQVRIKLVDRRNIGHNEVEVIAGSEANSITGRPLSAIVGADMEKAKLIKVDVEGAEGMILPGLLHDLQAADSDTIIVSEVSKDSAYLIDLAKERGFFVQALRNDYSIAHLLIRSMLRLTGEGQFFVLQDVDSYLGQKYDYVFSRRRLCY